MRILILGYIIRGPYGGLCFHHLQYILGLKKMGFEVLFYEDSDDHPGYSNQDSLETGKFFGFRFIQTLFSQYGLEDKRTYFDAPSNAWYGLQKEKVDAFCSTTDIVINLSGVNPIREWYSKIPVKIFVDTDPAFTQIRHRTDKQRNELAAEHSHHFSYAENIKRGTSKIPSDGYEWEPTRQPVVLDLWQMGTPISRGVWTTVMQWDSYGAYKFDGKIYGMKAESLKKFLHLPSLTDEKLELAIKSDDETKRLLETAGWNVVSSLVPTETWIKYQQYISTSKGEWSVAKHGYVVTNSGWFSERSLCYMASGKPAIVQDTGFSEFLPTGNGLFSFSSLQDSIEHLAQVNSNYQFHCKKARELVENHFESSKVLTSMLTRI